MQSLPVIVLGFLLGMLHATDADHVVAVSIIVGRQRSVGSAARIGLFWGVGHSVTVFAFGSAIILFNLVLPRRLELALDFGVAIMLIVLGLVALSRAVREHHQVRAARSEAHLHVPGAGLENRFVDLGVSPALLRPLSIGIVHGLAGSAAVALLVLTQIREPGWAAAYLLLFGAGTTAGMVLLTSMIAWPFMRTQQQPRVNLGLRMIGGLLSLGLGCGLTWKAGAAALS